jgi:YD repeat-containing protein
MWNYTYDGTATTTTTTTTTTHENLPYTDTSNTLYLNSYDQQGRMISQRWRTITTRQGGDGANTLGYNLGAALGAIHMKEHLLKSVVEDVAKGSRYTPCGVSRIRKHSRCCQRRCILGSRLRITYETVGSGVYLLG